MLDICACAAVCVCGVPTTNHQMITILIVRLLYACNCSMHI
jgi:hypothetical protein